MDNPLILDMICTPSEDVVAREIEGQLIIVPLAAGIGDMEDELYTLNDTGKAIWSKLDGVRSLLKISNELAEEYEASSTDIERDVLGLVGELVRRKMVIVKMSNE
jgi:hypothetical protein